jgi:AcrR family transcriptional regulator
VLEAARNEFEAVGFEAANVRNIAKRADVSAGTVLHHFGEKKELLYAALFDDLEATLDRALARSSGTLEKQASSLGAAVFAYYQKRPCPLAHAAQGVALRRGPVGREVRRADAAGARGVDRSGEALRR